MPEDVAHSSRYYRPGSEKTSSCFLGALRRKGTVVSLAEASESFVMQKLARRLGVAIPMLKLREGVIEPIDAAAAGTPAAVTADK